jgi:hypothetical protein
MILLARYWQLAIGAAVAIALALTLAIRTKQRDAALAGLERTQAAFEKTVGDYRLTAEKARADDLANARAIETRNAAIAEETQRDLQTKLASARADADRYAIRLRSAATADPGSGAGKDLPRTAQAPSGASGAGPTSELDDTRVCAVNTVLAEGWQDWWRQVSLIPAKEAR